MAAAIVVLSVYGGASFLPGLVGGFAASLAAFMLALSWERDRERLQGEREANAFEQRLTTEVRRRFASVRVELGKNAESLTALVSLIKSDPYENPAEFEYVHPQLLEGAWTANAPRLSELVADYELIADLAATYGRIEELRWRLRYRSERMSKDLDAMTVPLVAELRGEVTDLLERVGTQIDEPSVQPLGLMHVKTGTLGATVTTRSSLETEVIRRDQASVTSSSADSSSDAPGGT